ncbi:MAG: 6-pyruvoyl-tetrahydropterin synthase-related protein [Chloroflexota bacterium]
MKQRLLQLDPNIWLILALSGFAWAPLLTPAYFFNAHDARHSVFFLVEFDQTFRDGFLWPRWSPDFAFGYGYPLFNMYAPLAFYAAELLHLAGLGFTAAIKTMYVLATIGGGLGMYGFGQRLFGRRAGLLAAVVYVYVPFHLVEIFVRSAYAEFVALALVPLVFWTFTEVIAAPAPRRIALAGLSYGLLALTHHAIFFTFSPFLMIYLLYLLLAKSGLEWRLLLPRALVTAGAGGLGVALAAIYLLPVIVETKYIKVEQWTSGSYNYLQHFVYFSQLFSPEWGYGYAGPGVLDDLSFQLGIVVIGLVSFALVSLLNRRFPHWGTALFFLTATLAIIFLMSPLAEPIWQVIPIAALVQFPWRLLGMTAFTMSLVAGSLLAETDHQSPISQSSNLQSSNPTPLRPFGGDNSLPIPLRYAPSGGTIVSQSPISNLQSPNLQSPNLLISPLPLYLLALVIILASLPYTLPQYTEIRAWAETPLAVINWDRASIGDRVGMVWVTDRQPQTSPLEQQYLDGEPLTVAGIITGQGALETLHHGGASKRVQVLARTPVTVQFYTYDYPGWQVTLDGQPVAHRHEPPYGLISVDAPPGEHILLLRMGSTPPRTLGALISGLALLVMLGFYCRLWPVRL